MITSVASEEAFEILIQLHGVIDSPSVRDSIEISPDELAGRLGIRIIRDGDRLLRT